MVTTMTLEAQPPTTAWRGPVGLPGACRVMITAPAMIGSGLLMLVLFGWMGRWEAPVLLFWLSGSLAVMTRVGERVVLRVVCACRCLNDVEVARLITLVVPGAAAVRDRSAGRRPICVR